MLGTSKGGQARAGGSGLRLPAPRWLFHGSRLVPALVAAILIFLALRPMLFSPAETILGTLASMVGVGVSFSSVTFSCANACREHRAWSEQMIQAGLALLRFALAMVIALALATTRTRVIAEVGAEGVLDYLLRGLMVLVTAAGIVAAFQGFRHLVVLLFPRHAEEAASPTSVESGS